MSTSLRGCGTQGAFLLPQSGGGHSWGFGPDRSYLLEIFVVGLSSVFGFRLVSSGTVEDNPCACSWHTGCSFTDQLKLDLIKNMGKVRTILFAEDDQVLLTAYRKHLKQAGYAVIIAHDGLETIKNLSLFVPDLVILDLMMPKFDGAVLLQHICNTPRLANVSVIILSSKCFIDAEHEQLMRLADRYLVKQDCTPAILLKAIQEQLSDPFEKNPAKPAVSADSVPSIVRAGVKLFSTN
jgi:CheY-like chemotaxis protein